MPARAAARTSCSTRSGLADRAHHLPSELSTGQRGSGWAVARALIRSPRLLLADEPTGSLDRARALELVDLFSSLDPDVAVIVVTHDPAVAERLPDVRSPGRRTPLGSRRMIRLAWRAIRFHQRSAWGIAAAVALTSALLGGGARRGATRSGQSLADRVEKRLGPVHLVVRGGEMGFSEGVRGRPRGACGGRCRRRGARPCRGLDGCRARGRRRSARGGRGAPPHSRGGEWSVPGEGEVLLGSVLAAELGVGEGDAVVFRATRPSALPVDSALTREDDRIRALRATVVGVLDGDWPDGFALDATPGHPRVAILDRSWMQARMDRGPRIDLALVAGANALEIEEALASAWTIADGGLALP